MTEADILDELLVREGGWRDQVVRPDHSVDLPTNHGITLDTLNRHRDLLPHFEGRPHPLGVEDLRELDEDMAAVIYQHVFIAAPGFTAENVPYEPLRVQLIDFGVNSGPERATRWLQRVLAIPTTGSLDGHTLAVVAHWHTVVWHRPALALVNDALVAARSYMIRRAVASGTIRKEDSEGLQRRAMEFISHGTNI